MSVIHSIWNALFELNDEIIKYWTHEKDGISGIPGMF